MDLSLHHLAVIVIAFFQAPECVGICSEADVLGWIKTILTELGLWSLLGLALRTTLIIGAGLYVFRQFRGG